MLLVKVSKAIHWCGVLQRLHINETCENRVCMLVWRVYVGRGDHPYGDVPVEVGGDQEREGVEKLQASDVHLVPEEWSHQTETLVLPEGHDTVRRTRGYEAKVPA